MRKRYFALTAIAVGWSFLSLPVNAQAPDAVVSAYREYKTAKDRGDLPAAEAAASRALAASESRDGNGGVTAVLAMNLAIVRMGEGHKAEAIAPAQRALDLAAHGAKGVDPLAARLLLGEAEVSTTPKTDYGPLEAALQEADSRSSDIDDYAYPAAVALGVAARDAKQWYAMRVAWRSARLHIGGAAEPREFLLAQAMTQEALALVIQRRDEEADKLLTQAIKILAPLAPETQSVSTISTAEANYAEAIVIELAEEARRASEGKVLSKHEIDQRPGLPGSPALCQGALTPHPLPNFPFYEAAGSSVGAVIVRARVDSEGKVLDTHVIAGFPNKAFQERVADPRIKWTFERAKDAAPGCRVESSDRLVKVKFALSR